MKGYIFMSELSTYSACVELDCLTLNGWSMQQTVPQRNHLALPSCFPLSELPTLVVQHSGSKDSLDDMMVVLQHESDYESSTLTNQIMVMHACMQERLYHDGLWEDHVT